ncbi:unnamed protein product, partial [Didymodactylos carnosus]
LVANDEIKNEIIKQNAVPSIIKTSTDKADDATPLQILYSMSFKEQAVDQIKSDETFVERLRKQKQSDKDDVKKAASGIMWKLEDEKKFIEKQEEKENAAEAEEEAKLAANTEEAAKADGKTKPVSDDKDSHKSSDGDKKESSGSADEKAEDHYDFMISYSWSEKELVYKIHDRLEADGYKIWLDKDNMFGSIIERMAEAIEHSDMILVSMSSAYKKSPNCQAEAEYAYNRKRLMIPLITEDQYRADGWLGFIAGSKMYVDFHKGTFDEAYALLIAEIKRNQGADKPDDDNKKDKSERKKSTSSEHETTDQEEKKETSSTDGATSQIETHEEVEVVQASETQASPPEKIETPKQEDAFPPKSPPTSPSPVPLEIPIPDTREYSNIKDVNKWSEENVLEFLNDLNLPLMIPLCHTMDGKGLLELHRACNSCPDTMYSVLNAQLLETHQKTLVVATYFKFISELKKYIPAKLPQKITFQYRLFNNY